MGQEQVALCPKNIVLFLVTRLRQQLGFNLLPTLQSRVSASTETDRQVKGEGRASRPVAVPGPRNPPVTTVRAAPPRGELARPSREKEGEGSGVDAPFSPSPARPRRCAHRFGFCVLGSGTLTPHHPAEEIHLVAQPPASPAPLPKKTQPPPAPKGPSPRAGFPHSPAFATAASYSAAAPAP